MQGTDPSSMPNCEHVVTSHLSEYDASYVVSASRHGAVHIHDAASGAGADEGSDDVPMPDAAVSFESHVYANLLNAQVCLSDHFYESRG